jgi:hypothetical protein
MKIYWRVADKPTGRYRAFDKRSWPTAWWGKPEAADSCVAAFMNCADEYVPERVRQGVHAPITITVCHYNHPEAGNSSKRFRLKKQAATLDEAKQMVDAFYKSHPDWLPKEQK